MAGSLVIAEVPSIPKVCNGLLAGMIHACREGTRFFSWDSVILSSSC